MLFADERRTFRQLSVCPGGITVDLAERLCGPDALDLASRLVDRSLLVADTSGSAVRFTMLESLRAYGLARLEECSETASARTDHLSWCVELATTAHRETRGPAQLVWLARLDQEHDNVRAALGHAVSTIPTSPSGSSESSCCRGGSEGVVRRSASGSTPRSPPPGRCASPGRARVLAWSGLVAEPGPGPGGSTTDPRAELALAESHGPRGAGDRRGERRRRGHGLRLLAAAVHAHPANLDGRITHPARRGIAVRPRPGTVRPTRRRFRVRRHPHHRRDARDRRGRSRPGGRSRRGREPVRRPPGRALLDQSAGVRARHARGARRHAHGPPTATSSTACDSPTSWASTTR